MSISKANNTKRKQTWEFIKNRVADDDTLLMDYESRRNFVRVFVIEGNTMHFVNIFHPDHQTVVGQSMTNDADYVDFETNYKHTIDNKPPTHAAPVDLSSIEKDGGRLQIHNSPRPIIDGEEYITTWTGAGDDIDNHIIGEGTHMVVSAAVDTPISSTDIHFDPTFGVMYIQEGFLSWSNAGAGDFFRASVFTNPSVLQQSVNLDLILDGDVVKYSTGGPGTGTHGFAANPTIVINRASTGFWNYSPSDGLTPAFAGDGEYDIRTVEVEVNRVFNHIELFGTSEHYNRFPSTDYAQLPPGYFIRLSAFNISNTEWTVRVAITTYRERTASLTA